MTYTDVFLVSFIIYCLLSLISCFMYFKIKDNDELIQDYNLEEMYKQVTEQQVNRIANIHAFLAISAAILLFYGDVVML